MINKDLFDVAIFDMDGTIMDSLDVWEKIDREFLENKRGIKVPDDYVDAIAAMSFTEIANYTIERFNLPDTAQALKAEWTEMAEYEYSHNIFLKEGVREYIEKLKKQDMKIVLCTSSPDSFYVPCLKNNGVYELFDAFTNTCEAGEGKNSTKVFLLAAQKAGAEPLRCIVFEDVLSAAASAKRAGMKVCGVFDERGASYRKEMQKLCDYYIGSFNELL